VAGFVNGLSGAGFALVSLGFWLHAMSPITAAPLAAFCSVAGHVQSLPRIWANVSIQRLWPYLVAGLIGVPIGTALLDRVRVQPLKLGVGLLLIAYVSWMGLMRRPPIVRGGGRLADAAVALVAGVMGGLASVSGPAPAIWAQLRGWDRHQQRAVNQPFNMSVLALSVVTAGIAGFLDRTFFVWALMALPATLIGAQVGVRVYGRITDVQFRWIVLAILGGSGVVLVVSAL
jgi:uncharacterized membrane protein YfcA